ncbi:MAG: branched-chain amino acid transaminase [Deltaproteobacteria bacterium]|nr:branched-chain amino acid transaminase [Deltaproteobacteria bacterium]
MIQEASKIWMDGKFISWSEANVHVLTHTLHYGMGVFEGIRCYEIDGGSAIFRLQEHVDRLFASAHIMQMEIPYTNRELFEANLDTVRVNGLTECYIRPLVFIGYGDMGLYVKDNPIQVAVAAWPWGTYLGEDGLKNGIRVMVSSYARTHVNTAMTKAKACGSYINSQLAKREAIAHGYHEALLLDTEGYVSEGPGENIFIVRKGRIKTTPLTSILEGITRESVMTLAKEAGLEVTEERFTRDELYIADEAFFVGTAAEITPIREIDGRTIGEGKPGPVTRKIQSSYFEAVHGKNSKHPEWLAKI